MTDGIVGSFEQENIEANRAFLDDAENETLGDFLDHLISLKIDSGDLPPNGTANRGVKEIAGLAFIAGRTYQAMQHLEEEGDHIGEDGLIYIGLTPKAVRVLLNRELEVYE